MAKQVEQQERDEERELYLVYELVRWRFLPREDEGGI